MKAVMESQKMDDKFNIYDFFKREEWRVRDGE